MDDLPEKPIQIGSKYASIDEIRGKIPRPEDVSERIASASERTARAAERSARMAAGELVYDLPEDKEAQRKLVIGLVEQIETTDLPIGPIPNIYTLAERQTMNAIIRLLDLENCSPEVRREATARLRLQHCFAIAASIPGQTETAAGFLLSVFQQPESRRWALEGEDFSLFLKEGIEGLSIQEAFKKLEEASTVGVEIDGKRSSLMDKRLSPRERARVKQRIIQKLGGGKRAEKSFELAQRIAACTLETSVWNRDLIGNDPLAEAIYFEEYRTQRAEAARDRGPSVTIDRIRGFGTSYLRSAQTLNQIKIEDVDKNVYLFLPEDEDHPTYLTLVQDPRARKLATSRRNRGELPGFDVNKSLADQPDKVEMLPIEELEYESLKQGDYAGWLSIVVPRLLVFKSLLLKTTWERKDFSSDAIESYVAPSNAADPEQVLRLRSEFILGVFWSIYKRGEAVNLGWDAPALGGAEAHLTSRIKTKKTTLPAYLTRKQLEWVENTLRKQYHLNIHHQAAVTGVKIDLTKRVIG